jgi:hypothetical protein
MYTIACSNLHHMQITIKRIETDDTYLGGWNLEPRISYDKSQWNSQPNSTISSSLMPTNTNSHFIASILLCYEFDLQRQVRLMNYKMQILGPKIHL